MKLQTIWLVVLSLIVIVELTIILNLENETMIGNHGVSLSVNNTESQQWGNHERMIFADKFTGSATYQLNNAIASCGEERCFVFATPDMKEGAPSKLPDNVTLIDLRQESFRVIRNQPVINDYNMSAHTSLNNELGCCGGGSLLDDGTPQKFSSRPTDSAILAMNSVPANRNVVQDQALNGIIVNHSNRTNAVAIWGLGASQATNASVWGGFYSVGNFVQHDAQLVGIEIDVGNYAEEGISPYKSKVGMQIAGIGKAANTAAIEIISNGKGTWKNGIIFDNGSMTEDGTILGVSKTEKPMKLGIDFTNANFTDSAIRLGPNGILRMDTDEQHNPATIYGSKDGSLTLHAGSEGLKIMNNDGTKVIMDISNNGTITIHGNIKYQSP